MKKIKVIVADTLEEFEKTVNEFYSDFEYVISNPQYSHTGTQFMFVGEYSQSIKVPGVDSHNTEQPKSVEMNHFSSGQTEKVSNEQPTQIIGGSFLKEGAEGQIWSPEKLREKELKEAKLKAEQEGEK